MLKQRVITALSLLLGLLLLLFAAPDPVVITLFAVIAALAAWEWAGLLNYSARARVGYGLGFLLLAALFYVGRPGVMNLLWLASTFFWISLVPLWLIQGWRLLARPLAGALLGLLLLLSTWGALIYLYRRGPWILLAVLGAIWVADIAAYFSGRRWGQVKLAPLISPGKTREGAYGALVAVLAYGMLTGPLIGLWQYHGLPSLLLAAAILSLVTIISIIGDLFESLLKRQAGIKDSSQLLPGHGGILDRMDSVMSALPLMALMLTILS